MSKRVLVIVGHPAGNSFCMALAEAYADAAKKSGHEIRFMALGALSFDPVLREGYAQVQPLEPDLVSAQEAIVWSQRITMVYPIWWGGIPALMKGFFDRVLLPGFAFRYRPGKAFPEKLLRGRTAHLLVTMDTPPWYFKWMYQMPGLNQVRKTTLSFCGIKPRKTATFGPILGASLDRRNRWLKQARTMAAL